MAAVITKILQGAKATLTPDNLGPSSDIATTTERHNLAVDDTTAHEGEVRVDVTFGGGTVGQAVNIYLAQSNFDGTVVDGNCLPAQNSLVLDILTNLGVPASVITQATSSAGSGVFRCTTAAFIIAIHNDTTAAISSLTVNVTPLSYSSE